MRKGHEESYYVVLGKTTLEKVIDGMGSRANE